MYKEKIFDATTGKETFRDYSQEEIAEIEKAQAEAAAELKMYEEKLAKRKSALAKLAELGLTEDEIAAL